MENYLKEINSVLGVTGSFICLPDTSLAAAAMPANVDPSATENAARIVTQTINALQVLGQRVAEADLVYAQGRLIVKNLGTCVLVISCARNINLSLLNLTANVVVKQITAGPKPQDGQSQPPPRSDEVGTAPASRAAEGVISSEIMPARFFDALARELARVMGPAASFFIEDELSELKETREAFPKARAAELIERLSLAIRDETKRAKFVQTISETIQRL